MNCIRFGLGAALTVCSAVMTAQAIEPLQVVFAAEMGSHAAPSSKCEGELFAPFSKVRAQDLVDWARANADAHSNLLLAEEELINVSPDVQWFDIARLKKALGDSAFANEHRARLMEWQKLISQIEKGDKILALAAGGCLGAGQSKEAIDKAYMAASKAYWKYEAIRRADYYSYNDLVTSVVRFDLGIGDSTDGTAIVLLAPYVLLSKEKEFVELKNTSSIADMIVSFKAGETFGYMRPRNWKLIANRHLIVGGYAVARDEWTRRTYLHELAHYLGIAHTFTDSQFRDTDSTTEGTYLSPACAEVFRLEPTTENVEMCNCPFIKNKKGVVVFNDYDFAQTGVDDTGLVVANPHVPRGYLFLHNFCWKNSDAYKGAFAEADVGERNLMGYVTAQMREGGGSALFMMVSPKQQARARATLESFEH